MNEQIINRERLNIEEQVQKEKNIFEEVKLGLKKLGDLHIAGKKDNEQTYSSAMAMTEPSIARIKKLLEEKKEFLSKSDEECLTNIVLQLIYFKEKMTQRMKEITNQPTATTENPKKSLQITEILTEMPRAYNSQAQPLNNSPESGSNLDTRV